MTEEAFLRYRMAVVERMPDSPTKRALIIAIQSRMKALKVGVRLRVVVQSGSA
jgi:hypothetical protein